VSCAQTRNWSNCQLLLPAWREVLTAGANDNDTWGRHVGCRWRVWTVSRRLWGRSDEKRKKRERSEYVNSHWLGRRLMWVQAQVEAKDPKARSPAPLEECRGNGGRITRARLGSTGPQIRRRRSSVNSENTPDENAA